MKHAMTPQCRAHADLDEKSMRTQSLVRSPGRLVPPFGHLRLSLELLCLELDENSVICRVEFPWYCCVSRLSADS